MERRNTIQRQLVAEAVCRLDHPQAEEVYEEVSREHPHISKATVYRNLNLLAEDGTIGKLHLSEGADRFDFRPEKHYHLRCKKCGKVFDAHIPLLPELEQVTDEADGFCIESYQLEFIGICAACNKQA